MSVNAAYEITWSGILGGQFVQTVQHVGADEAGTENAFATAQNIINPTNFNGVNTDFMNILPSDYALSSVRCRRVLGGLGPTAVFLAGDYNDNVGARSGQISSAQVNPVILWIPLDEPTHLGKLFIPGVSESDIDAMAIAAGLIAVIGNFTTTWIGGITVGAETYVGVVARRATTSPFAVVDASQILFGQISPLIGTQRRRLRPV